MELREILKKLEFNEGVFPREAVEQAIARRDEIISELLKIVEQVKQNTQEVGQQPKYMAHLFAMYLLAQFRETRAYPLIVDFFSVPGEISKEVTGDFVTEDLGRVLASVCGGDTRLMEQLIEKENADQFIRAAPLDGMLALVASGVRSREETMAYFQALFRGKLKRTPSFVWSDLVNSCLDLWPEEVLQDIKAAYAEDLVSEFDVSEQDVEQTLRSGKEIVLWELRTNKHYTLIDDTIGEMEWWACFDPPRWLLEKRQRERLKAKRQLLASRPKLQETKPRPIGRNDPCPCGSGKKYKKCCGAG